MNDPSSSKALARSFWTPGACLIAVELYASNFDGWGAWSTGPLFLVPLVLSLAIASAGTLQCILEFQAARSIRRSSVVFTLLAILPTLWFVVRRHIL